MSVHARHIVCVFWLMLWQIYDGTGTLGILYNVYTLKIVSVLVCPYNQLRFISDNDVASYSVMDSLIGYDFIDIITVVPDLNREWAALEVPNEEFVIYQLTTRGTALSGDRYVSKFSLEYSAKDNGQYILYPMVMPNIILSH